jgi:serine/threonine protein phosphatase PrpC
MFNSHDYGQEYGFRKPIEKFTGPYINAEPDIQVIPLTIADKYLILASDGLWDEVKRKETAQIASQLIKEPLTLDRFKNRDFTF